MKGILFLDFDGVLNSHAWYTRRSAVGQPECELDPDAVAQLSRILDEAPCDIVVSSTWRRHFTTADLKGMLVRRGMRKEHWFRVIGKTPVLDQRRESGLYVSPTRGDEIQAWINAYSEPVGQVVILDDDTDMGDLRPYLVQTSMNIGLNVALADEVIERFKWIRHQSCGSSSDGRKSSSSS